MAKDLYIEILNILKENKPQEETALKLVKLVNEEVVDEWMELMNRFKKEHCMK